MEFGIKGVWEFRKFDVVAAAYSARERDGRYPSRRK